MTEQEIELCLERFATCKTTDVMNFDYAGTIAYINRLKVENAALRERLEKAVELPVKVGDTVYFIPTYNRKPIWGVQRGIVQMVGITRQGYHVKIRDRSDFNKTYMFRKSAFLSKEQAEARLAELQGEEKNG